MPYLGMTIVLCEQQTRKLCLHERVEIPFAELMLISEYQSHQMIEACLRKCAAVIAFVLTRNDMPDVPLILRPLTIL